MALDFTQFSAAELLQAEVLGRLPAVDGLTLEAIHYTMLRLTGQILACPEAEEELLSEMDKVLQENREFLTLLRRNAGDAAFPPVMESFLRWGNRGDPESPLRQSTFRDFLGREIGSSLRVGYPYDALRMLWTHATFRVPAPDDVYGWGFPSTRPPSPAGSSPVPLPVVVPVEVSRPGDLIDEEGSEEEKDEASEDGEDELEGSSSERSGRGVRGGGDSEEEVDALFENLMLRGRSSSPSFEELGRWTPEPVTEGRLDQVGPSLEELGRWTPGPMVPDPLREPLFLPDPSDADGLTPLWRAGRSPSPLRFDETDVSQTPPPRPRTRRPSTLVRVDSRVTVDETDPVEEPSRAPIPAARRIRLLPLRGNSNLEPADSAVKAAGPPLRITLPARASLKPQEGKTKSRASKSKASTSVPKASTSKGGASTSTAAPRPLTAPGSYEGEDRCEICRAKNKSPCEVDMPGRACSFCRRRHSPCSLASVTGRPPRARSTPATASSSSRPLPTPSLTTGSTHESVDMEFEYNGLLGPVVEEAGDDVSGSGDESGRLSAKQLGKRKAE
ncbi:hypothetical protein EIP91_012378 [Steccherinum ochraceum]|uniref:Zn(2)-C6 fungal-type domain-containing protein n=1 Tax=Steccherinum ochraceum TaxID=92696 RepID=A0A4R0RGR6_9APHY|nr:hypothetical protein EIP91_012378 [Steccherinum ochraceum]